MEIRRAIREDGPAILDLIRNLAQFEKLTPPDEAAGQRFLRDAFDASRPRVELWVAAADGGQLVGYAGCFETYSSFRGLPTYFLEDLFVHPSARRQGVATALLARLREEAERRGCGRFEWFVLGWNEDAKALYRGVGAELVADWQLMRVDLRDPPTRRP